MKLRTKNNYYVYLLLSLFLLFGGCATWRKLNGTERGAVIGGGTGAIVGNAVAPGVGGTVLGGAVGAVAGGAIGHEEDRDERRRR